MRRSLLLIATLLFSTTAFAQDRDEDWRRRGAWSDTPRGGAFEITPFIGYRWGGTIFADQTFIFGEDVQVSPSANFGVNLGIPLGDSGMKLELMANRQSSDLETDGGIFEPNDRVAEIDVTYLHAGVQVPFARSRNATPYFIGSAGIANLDPQLAGISAETRFSASAGIGVKVPINRALGIRLEGRGYYTSLEQDSDCTLCDYLYNQDFYQGEVNLGLTLSF